MHEEEILAGESEIWFRELLGSRAEINQRVADLVALIWGGLEEGQENLYRKGETWQPSGAGPEERQALCATEAFFSDP